MDSVRFPLPAHSEAVKSPKWQHWSARSKQVTCNFTPAIAAFMAAGEARSWWRSHLAQAESQSNCWAFQGMSFPEVGRQVENLLAAARGHLLPWWGSICAFCMLSCSCQQLSWAGKSIGHDQLWKHFLDCGFLSHHWSHSWTVLAKSRWDLMVPYSKSPF